MLYFRSLDGVEIKNSWLTIGSFDGVHRGHQAILKKLIEGARANGAPAVVITFFPHPAVILGKRKNALYLNTPEERAELLGEYGADAVVMHPFNTHVANLTAYEFMHYLHQHLYMKHMLVGPDFALGKGREGNTQRLAELGEHFGYTLEVMPMVVNGDIMISSSQIRTKLFEGDVEGAARLLGRPYRISGDVVHGDARGKSIGIPTANLSVWAERTIPKSGVYACKAWVEDKPWDAVTNIGVRPTFEAETVIPRVEAHLLGFDDDLYGKEIKLDFVSRLRDEQRFASVQALIDQINRDIETTRRIL